MLGYLSQVVVEHRSQQLCVKERLLTGWGRVEAGERNEGERVSLDTLYIPQGIKYIFLTKPEVTRPGR